MLQRILLLALTGCSLSAQTFEYWPGATYDPAVPTMRQVIGYDVGDRIAPHADIMKYFDALAAAQPKRIKIFEYAKTWENRKLVYAAIGSEANIARLSEIQNSMKRLADPRKTSDADAKAIIANLPAVIWLGYGVHGNEISSPDAALMTAYHLLAARNDKMVDNVLANVLVLIDPLQNPDGRQRFINNFETNEGSTADSNPLAAEHSEPWPGGRTNHYFFDMNRDWVAITQPETKGRIKTLLEWYPLVFVDLHEMGTESTYYFSPESQPYNPHLAKDQIDALTWYGKNNARYFDQYGFQYFTREVYDAFYPGYGASWPAYYGSVAMTYENGSTRGLTVRRNDDSIITFRETVRRHFTSSIATCETSAQHREDLLQNFYKYRQTAIAEGSSETIREYILPRRGDVGAVDKLAQLLVFQGVEVSRANGQFTAGGKQYPTGSYVVSLAQPSKRLIRTLLDPVVAMDDTFLKGEERRRLRRLSSEVYDVTAWSVPLQYNVEAIAANAKSSGNFEALQLNDKPGAIPPATTASVAYLVPWGSQAAGRVLTGALLQNLRVLSTDKSFTQNGRKFSAGTLIIPVKNNPADLQKILTKLAETAGAEIVATDTGWVDDGVNFGSAYVNVLKKPEIALAWDRPTSSTSAGQTRFVLERQFGYPVTVVRTELLGSADISRFHVIILPDGGFGGGYAGVLGPDGARRLKEWVRDGGTLIGIGSAMQFLADPKSALLAVRQEDLAKPGEVPTKKPETPEPSRAPGKLFKDEADFDKAIQPETELPGSAHGILARVKVDSDQWISAGLPDTLYAMVQGRAIYAPIKIDRGVNAVIFEGPDKVVASGYLWDEYRKQLAYKPFVIVQREGRGTIIGFTADPNFRGYMDGLNVLFLNAVFRGSAHNSRGFGAEEEL